jgi:hypothetical protein
MMAREVFGCGSDGCGTVPAQHSGSSELCGTTPLIPRGVGWRRKFRSKKQTAVNLGREPRCARMDVQVRGDRSAPSDLPRDSPSGYQSRNHAIHASLQTAQESYFLSIRMFIFQLAGKANRLSVSQKLKTNTKPKPQA